MVFNLENCGERRKAEIFLLICEASDIKPPLYIGDACQIKSYTKPFGIVIDNHLPFRQHVEERAEKVN